MRVAGTERETDAVVTVPEPSDHHRILPDDPRREGDLSRSSEAAQEEDPSAPRDHGARGVRHGDPVAAVAVGEVENGDVRGCGDDDGGAIGVERKAMIAVAERVGCQLAHECAARRVVEPGRVIVLDEDGRPDRKNIAYRTLRAELEVKASRRRRVRWSSPHEGTRA